MQDDTTANPQAGDAVNQPPVGDTHSSDPQVGDENTTLSVADAKKLRSEAKNLRLRLKEFEDREKKTKESQMSESERLQQQYAELQQQHTTYVQDMQTRLVRYEIERQSSKLGIIDADAALKLIDLSELEFDDGGMPTNADDLLKKLVKAKPYLVNSKVNQTSVSATNPSRSSASAHLELSWDLISKMTQAEYAARGKEIQQWIQQNSPRYGTKLK